METEKKVYKSSEAQRAANRRYREKVKDTEEYKQKNLAWVKKYNMNNYENLKSYQREYKRNDYQEKKLQIANDFVWPQRRSKNRVVAFEPAA